MSSNPPILGIKAVFDDSDAKKRIASYQARIKTLENAVTGFTDATERNAKRRSNAAKKASDSQIKSLIAFRRQLITVLFFLRFFTQAVRVAWGQMVEGVETRALIQGVRSLASAYGHSLGEITHSMSEMAGSLVDDMNNVRVAQAGLLADHGRFVESYDELWQAARVASVTAGGDAIKIFSQLVEALNDADAATVDTASGIFRVELALIKFAVASGRTRDELSDQEKRQVILNEVMRTTNALLDSGAQAALDATKPLDELRKAWGRLTLVLGTIFEPLLLFDEFLDNATMGLILLIASVGAASVAIKHLGGILDDLVHGRDFNLEEKLNEMFDEANRVILAAVDRLNRMTFDVGGGDGGGVGITGTLAVVPDDPDLEDQLRRYEEFLKKIHSLRERYMKEMESLELRFIQRLEELEFMRGQRLEDIFIKAQRKREDLQIQLQRRLEDADRNYYRALERLERNNARKRERIWQRYWEAVRRINRKFSEDIYDAIAARDATAALKAIRKRKNDLDDAAHARNLNLQNLRRDNEIELEELRLRRDRAREDALRSYQEGLDDLARWIKREQDELERHLENQRRQIENWHKWRLQAIGEQYRLEYLAALAAYTGQESLLADHVNRMNALWASMLSTLNLPAIPPPPGGSRSGISGGVQEFAHGGAAIFDRPTRILVGEGPRPEMVLAVPLGGQVAAPVSAGSMNVDHRFTGAMDHRVQAEISGAMQGMQGRIEAAFLDAIRRVM